MAVLQIKDIEQINQARFAQGKHGYEILKRVMTVGEGRELKRELDRKRKEREQTRTSDSDSESHGNDGLRTMHTDGAQQGGLSEADQASQREHKHTKERQGE